MKKQGTKLFRKLALRRLYKNKAETIGIVLAIVMTSLLLTVALISSDYIGQTLRNIALEKSGWSGHLIVADVSDYEYEMMAQNQYVEAVSKYTHIGFLEEEQYDEVVELQYSEALMAQWMYYGLAEGRMPVASNEIVISKELMENKGIVLAEDTSLRLAYQVNGEVFEDTFKITGFYEKKETSAEVALVSKAFLQEKSTLLQNKIEVDSMYNKQLAQVLFKDNKNIETSVSSLLQEIGLENHRWMINRAYIRQTTTDLSYLMGIIGIVIVIVLCAFIIIYNIYSIGIVKDTKYYGDLSTLGVRSKEIRKMIYFQVNILCTVGIPLGIFLGLILSVLLLPNMVDAIDRNVIDSTPNVRLLIGVILFTYITVCGAASKPLKVASQLSPSRARQYNPIKVSKKISKKGYKFANMAWKNAVRDKKKSITIWVSLSFSIILACLFYTIVQGASLDAFVSDMVVSDYILGTHSYFNSLEGDFDCIDEKTLESIKNLEGIEGSGGASIQTIPIKLKGDRFEFFKRHFSEEVEKFGDNSMTRFIGIDDYIIDKIRILDGDFDLETFKSGEYVLANMFVHNPELSLYKPGEKVTLQVGDSSKTYTVMALIQEPYEYSPRVRIEGVIELFVPREEWVESVKDTSYYVYGFDVADSMEPTWNQVLSELEDGGNDISYESKKKYEEQFNQLFSILRTVGIFITSVFSFIGIFNFSNVLNTNIYNRRYELAVLQCMGMSRVKLYGMLVLEAAYHLILTFMISLVIGLPIVLGLTELVRQGIPFIERNIPIKVYVIAFIIGCIMSVVMPVMYFHSIDKKEHLLRG